MTNRPDGDIWILVDRDPKSQYFGRNFKFDFSYITSDKIKDIVKDYVWQNHRVGNKSLSSIHKEVRYQFIYFIKYADTKGIKALSELNNSLVEEYVSYLHTVLSRQKQEPLSYRFQKICLDALKAVIHWCQVHRPADVPMTEIFTGNEYTGVNRKLTIDFIPDDVLAQINKALITEENPYLKYGIIILQSTGMRIGDLLALHIDCIKPNPLSGGYTIEWFQHKTRKYIPPTPVRDECAIAVNRLIELTAPLRDEAIEKDKNNLLIHRVLHGDSLCKYIGKAATPSSRLFDYWLKKFIKDHEIKDANGNYYNLTSHQFRRTLGTDMLSKGVSINVIQQVLGHSDPSVTKRFYADVKDKERAKVFKDIGVIGNINQLTSDKFDNESEYKWFKANKDSKACICDGYCTKPIVNGKRCIRLYKRDKCYTCSRYITTPEYLDAHKQYLARLEDDLRVNSDCSEHYRKHIIPIIEVLKVIIEKLEALKNEN